MRCSRYRPLRVITTLIALAGLACSLPAALARPTPAPPTRGPSSGLAPVQPTEAAPTGAATPTSGGLQPASGLSAEAPCCAPASGTPTLLPDVSSVPPEIGRPRLSGETKSLDTAHFRIHYTLAGTDAVPDADADGDGHPDFVDEVARAMEYSWQVQIDQFGWAPPPPDGGDGGDDRYDVYLHDILVDGTAGYADGGYPQTLVGDNPRTEVVELRSSYSYLGLDNDYAELDMWGDENATWLTLMQSSATHEFLHALQYGYDGEEPAGWLWEATATWIQDEVFDDIDDGIGDLPSVFKSPDTCQVSEGLERVESDGHWYGLWIFLRYISERHGHAAVRAIWEQARALDGYAALEAALSDAGTSLDEVQRGFNLALLTRDFEEGAAYPLLRLEGTARPGQPFVPADGVGQMGADYVEIEAAGAISVRLPATGLAGTLAGVRAGQLSVFPLVGDQASVDAGEFEHLYLVVANMQHAQDESECAFVSYTVVLEQGGQPQTPVQTLPAPNFAPPQFETLLDPDEYYGVGEPVDAPPELIPAYLPAGYELADSYLLDKSEFGAPEDALWYVPGEGPATVLDFYAPGDLYLSVTASASPYRALDEWLAAVDYVPAPEEWRSFGGVSVLLSDWSDGDVFSSATYIHGREFVVVEGTITLDELARVVESLVLGKR